MLKAGTVGCTRQTLTSPLLELWRFLSFCSAASSFLCVSIGSLEERGFELLSVARLTNLRAEGFGYFFLMIFTFQLFCIVLGQLIVSASANLLIAQQVISSSDDHTPLMR
jgi:hypothetical protein